MGSWMVRVGRGLRFGKEGGGVDVSVIMLECPAVQVVREVGGASDAARRRSAGHSSCGAETGTHSVPGAVPGGCGHAHGLCNDRCVQPQYVDKVYFLVVAQRLIPMFRLSADHRDFAVAVH